LNARAATPSTRPAAVGCDRRDGCSQYRPRPARQADVAVRPPSPPGRGTPGPGQTASHPSASVTAAYPTDLHIESELSGPMRNAKESKGRRLRRSTHRAHPSSADRTCPVLTHLLREIPGDLSCLHDAGILSRQNTGVLACQNAFLCDHMRQGLEIGCFKYFRGLVKMLLACHDVAPS
jgi:hypothetical protein